MLIHRFGRYTEEAFIAAVAASTSKRQVMLKLGVIAEGGNYATISRHIKTLGLDTSHFLGQAARRGSHRPIVPIERYLNNEVATKSNELKRRLLREGILQPICVSCHNTEWLGKPIPLELDHKDGDNQNNHLDNLRLLCPNCHAQTPTYRGKNIKKLVPPARLELATASRLSGF